MGRFVAGQLIGFLASIGIARLVSPAEFGQFALAAAVQQAGTALMLLGLPASLVRQREAPTPEQEHAVAGFTLALGVACAACAVVIGFVLLPVIGIASTTAKVIAITCSSLPILALRAIPGVTLARLLRFERLVVVDIAARLVFNVAALAGAWIGFGAYGLAAAVPISAIAHVILISRVQPWRPGFSLNSRLIRELAGFGIQVSGFRILMMVQELSLIALLATFGSQALAGFYGMSRRLLGLPYAALTSIQRVGLPALSRIDDDELRARRAAQAAVVTATVMGCVLSLIAGAAQPLISTLLGARWLPSTDIIVIGSAGLLLSVSIGAAVNSYAFARGDARISLLSIVVQITVTTGIVILAVPGLGAPAAGIAVGAGYTLLAATLVAFEAPAPLRSATLTVLRALLVAGLAAGVGQLVRFDDGIAELAAALAATGSTWLALSWLLARSELKLGLNLFRRHVLPT
jgi:O-antigen/teichoic acid export membrane protein